MPGLSVFLTFFNKDFIVLFRTWTLAILHRDYFMLISMPLRHQPVMRNLTSFLYIALTPMMLRFRIPSWCHYRSIGTHVLRACLVFLRVQHPGSQAEFLEACLLLTYIVIPVQYSIHRHVTRNCSTRKQGWPRHFSTVTSGHSSRRRCNEFIVHYAAGLSGFSKFL